MEDERKNHEHKMKKMETEMEQVFELKVKERNQRIIDSENDVSSGLRGKGLQQFVPINFALGH